MWSPRGLKIACCQGFLSRFLLADCPRRGQRVGPEMPRVPKVPLQTSFAIFCAQDYSHSLALCGLGFGYGGAKTARGGMTHLLVVVDKFTKWIEAKPIKKLNGPTAVTFITDITPRYSIDIASSQTTAQTLPKEPWLVSARRRASDWT